MTIGGDEKAGGHMIERQKKLKKPLIEIKGKIKSPKRKRIILGTILILLVLLIVAALYLGLTVRNYIIESDKINNGGSVRIVEISDLHSSVFGNDQKPLIDMIKTQRPDIITLTGDIVDDKEPVSGAKLFLEKVKDIAPVYYVSGNHEFWSRKCDDIKKMIEGYGITVLSNERRYVTVNGVSLCICGIDDPYVFEYSKDTEVLKYKDVDGLLERFSDIDDSTFNILLAHRPELIDDYRKYNFDLVLSGHTHGGQVRIPLILNGLFAPNQGYFPKYAGGRYDFSNMTMIISRGLSIDKKTPRIFDPPEVVVVDIKGKVK